MFNNYLKMIAFKTNRSSRVLTLLSALILLLGLIPLYTNAASEVDYRRKVSDAPTTVNASSDNLPSSSLDTVYAGREYFFNLETSSETSVKTAELYIKYPGSDYYKRQILRKESASILFLKEICGD